MLFRSRPADVLSPVLSVLLSYAPSTHKMASDAQAADATKDPLLSTLLTSTMTPLLVRPAIMRTASSRSLPPSSHPRVTIVIPLKRLPQELVAGVKELAVGSARGNVTVVEGDAVPRGGNGAFVWVVG